MPQNDILFSKSPDWGKLTLAIIEHIVEPVLGENAIKIVGEHKEKKILYDKLCEALKQAEKNYIETYTESKIAINTIQLPLANLKSIQQAFWHFVEVPDSHAFRRVLYKQLSSEYVRLSEEERRLAADNYLQLLKIEIISIDEETRQKLSAAALLSIDSKLDLVNTTLNSIDGRIKQLVEILMQSAGQGINAANRKSDTLSLIKGDDGVARDSLEITLGKVMERLSANDVVNFSNIITAWFTPTIEHFLKEGDFYRSYGLIIQNIVEQGMPSTNGSDFRSLFMPDDLFSFDFESYEKNISEWNLSMKRIFNSYLVRTVSRDTNKLSHGYHREKSEIKGVYLKSLSSQFPIPGKISEPYGYYLVRYKSYGHKKFELFCVTDENFNGWSQFTEDVPDGWREKAAHALINATGNRQRYFIHGIAFNKQSIHYWGNQRGRLKVEINHQNFATFILNFATDYLSLASQALEAEQEALKGIQDLSQKLRSEK